MSKENQAAPEASADMVKRSEITAEYLMKEFPQIAGVLIKEGRQQSQETIKKEGYDEGVSAGAEAERARIMALEDMAVSGHEDMVLAAKKDGKTQPGELAMKIVAAQKQRGFAFLETRREEARTHADIGPSTDRQALANGDDPAAPIEERAAAEWRKDPKIRSEFGDVETYTAFRKAEDEGRVRRFAK